ncbi:bifunctional phosphopantothenoylcysteine decarboxylase/phosphopantothenate--cysteine ligase CoaBC [Polynucleobacter rarus]|uniref:bifunctional phosphopantothenoylcysteine decarboxylase/phosphopantothenate--cysteine ligase CoaBC n=1 Tax=Polynucleobacter rarus TaxID=556055 RepID=UPI000D3E0773|nr:bifunctional phosphopantothenoylcysteine decarboxylase/phosphopantothenate--cysteine ligase CoaBC [Polynucleobacter rarus]
MLDTPNEFSLHQKKILLGITGGIAAYKTPELVRALIKEGATVQVVMTRAATQFVTPTTLQAVSGLPVFVSQWDDRISNGMPHIELSRDADLILVAPASADFMAKHSLGLADDLLSTLCLARGHEINGIIKDCPLVMVPAMNRQMWEHPATQRSVDRLKIDNVTLLGPASGAQACGEVGMGRMLEPSEILEGVIAFFQPKLLNGYKVLITAGPTYEPIDPVRGITNLSSGKMGFAIARAALEAGAQVHLVSGPVSLATPLEFTGKVIRTNVQTAKEMMTVVENSPCDIFFSVAAVADWTIKNRQSQKIKKTSDSSLPVLEFELNPDILATIANSTNHPKPFCVGFAAESENIEEYAQQKRLKKNLPMLIANHGPSTFGKDENQVSLIDENGIKPIQARDKLSIARIIISELSLRLHRKNN